MANVKSNTEKKKFVFDNGNEVELNEAELNDIGTGRVKTIKSKAIKGLVIGLVFVAIVGVGLGAGWGINNNNQTNVINSSIQQSINDARGSADTAIEDAGTAMTAATKAKEASQKAYDTAKAAKTLEEAKAALRLATEGQIENEGKVSKDNIVAATTQAANAAKLISSAKTKIENSITVIENIDDQNMTEELKQKAEQLNKLLGSTTEQISYSDLQQNKVTLAVAVDLTKNLPSKENGEVINSVVDAESLAEVARYQAEAAAAIANQRILEISSEARIPNEVIFDVENDTDLANLVKGSNVGKVEEFLGAQYSGTVLSLYFGGKDAWRQDAVYAINVETKDSVYKYDANSADKYSNEIKSLIKEQAAKSKVFAKMAENGKFVSYDYVTRTETTNISYSILSRDESGNFSESKKVTMQEKGKLSEEEVLAKIAEKIEKSNSSYIFVAPEEFE